MAEFGQTMEEITLLRNGTNEFDSYHTTYISCERLWLASLSYNFLIHGHSDYEGGKRKGSNFHYDCSYSRARGSN